MMYTADSPDASPAAGGRDLHAEVDALANKVRELTEEVVALKEAAAAAASRDRLYDVKALANRWGVSVRTVHNVVAEGYIVPTYIKTALRFTWAAIEAYERGNTGWDKRRRTHRVIVRRQFNPATGYMEKPVR